MSMCFRGILNFIIRCQIAVYQGFTEFCQKGCLIGATYLVKPNYHRCERRLWLAIFIVCSSFSFYLILFYMNNYSQNVYRIVIESHGRSKDFNYPTMGICPMGVKNDEQTLIKVEQVLNGTLYKQIPSLSMNDEVKQFVYMLTFQNRKNKGAFGRFINYTESLAPEISELLMNYDYRKLVKEITAKCEDFFVDCYWLNIEFKCCEIFREVSTMLGKCFLFNSNQTYSPEAAQKVKEIEIFKEPFRFNMTFKNAAKIFILNVKDIPETIAPFPRYNLDDKGFTLNLQFNILPMLNDPVIFDLDSQNSHCIQQNNNFSGYEDKLYPFESFTTCITERLFMKQNHSCECVNLYHPKTNITYFCNLSQYGCLERNGLINPKSVSENAELMEGCLPTCEDSEYVVENEYYSESGAEFQDVYAVDFVFLNFPTTHIRRQAIRQSEDQMVSFSGIVGLFMNLCVVNVLEFIYLTCCAFWKYKQTSMTQGATTTHSLQKPTAKATNSRQASKRY